MKKKLLIYYLCAAIFIIVGFIVGTHSEKVSEGYIIYDYSQRVQNVYGSGSHYASKELGDSHIEKTFGWFMNDIITDSYYYAGNIKIPEETIKKSIPFSYIERGYDYEDDLHHVNTTSIIATVIMITLILLLPLFALFIAKFIKKMKKNNQFKEMKKLKEKLDLGMISKEEFEREKFRIINKDN